MTILIAVLLKKLGSGFYFHPFSRRQSHKKCLTMRFGHSNQTFFLVTGEAKKWLVSRNKFAANRQKSSQFKKKRKTSCWPVSASWPRSFCHGQNELPLPCCLTYFSFNIFHRKVKPARRFSPKHTKWSRCIRRLGQCEKKRFIEFQSRTERTGKNHVYLPVTNQFYTFLISWTYLENRYFIQQMTLYSNQCSFFQLVEIWKLWKLRRIVFLKILNRYEET